MVKREPGVSVTVIEKESALASHQTGNNSGVIHSGLYYRPGSLKARLCVEGRAALLQFCQEYDVPHEVCGKVVVAIDTDEVPQLETLHDRATANGLEGVRRITIPELCEFEPNCSGVAALFVPQTGIVDYPQVTRTLASRVSESGGDIRFGTRLLSIVETSEGVRVETSAGDFLADRVVSCAGLQSDRVAQLTEEDLDLRIVPFRGEYYVLNENAKRLVRNLIYPVPNPEFPFLGVHFTRMISGDVECGPNAVLALDREGYRKLNFSARDSWDTLSWPGFHKVARKYWKTGLGEVHRSVSKAAFTKALQRLVPEITESDLVPAGSGIRAQACGRDGTLLDDFALRRSGRITHVVNAPSPAATASMAIARHIVDQAVQ
ncbi:MAG: L-2-hydroxyglutarate oxidase [Ilumatobacteraceae bacterium]